MNKTIPTILGVLMILLVAGVTGVSVMFFSQDFKEVVVYEEESFIEEDETSTINNLKTEEDEFANWKVYENERYNYEIRYPENYRIANFIMEEKGESTVSLKNYELEEYDVDESKRGKDPSAEDWVVITDMTAEEEKDYLKGDYDKYIGGYGPLTAPGNFPAGTILIAPDSGLTYTDEIEENINNGVGVLDDESGFKWSDFRKKETKSGIEVREWKFVGRHELVNASIALPEKIIFSHPAYDGSSEHIERMKYFDQIRFWTPFTDDYDGKIFSKIVSTFKFLD